MDEAAIQMDFTQKGALTPGSKPLRKRSKWLDAPPVPDAFAPPEQPPCCAPNLTAARSAAAADSADMERMALQCFVGGLVVGAIFCYFLRSRAQE